MGEISIAGSNVEDTLPATPEWPDGIILVAEVSTTGFMENTFLLCSPTIR